MLSISALRAPSPVGLPLELPSPRLRRPGAAFSRMNLADKARDYANALVAAKKKHLRPGWLARRVFGAKPHVLRFEEYHPTDWPSDEPNGKPIHAELILPPGVSREECAEEPEVFAFVFRPEGRELVIMDVSGPRMGICFSMVFDDQRQDFVLNRRLWIS